MWPEVGGGGGALERTDSQTVRQTDRQTVRQIDS